jgi:hypothetical protein
MYELINDPVIFRKQKSNSFHESIIETSTVFVKSDLYILNTSNSDNLVFIDF